MKRIFIFLSLAAMLGLAGCEGLNLNLVILDNQSDFDVSVELYIGNTREDGSRLFEYYDVSAHTTEKINAETDRVYVDSYSPSSDVEMDVEESRGRITFTNK